jgi:hypothetical protein
MSGVTNQACTAIAAYAKTLAIVSGSSPTPQSSIPAIGQGQGYVVVDSPKLILVPGSWEERTYTVTMHYLMERTLDEATDQTRANDALDAFVAAWRAEDGLGGGLVATCEIRSADTGKYYDIGSSSYQSVDVTLEFQMFTGQTYTAGV